MDDELGLWLVRDLQVQLSELRLRSSYNTIGFFAPRLRRTFFSGHFTMPSESPLMDFQLFENTSVSPALSDYPSVGFSARATRVAVDGSVPYYSKTASVSFMDDGDKWVTDDLGPYRKYVFPGVMVGSSGSVFYPFLTYEGIALPYTGLTRMLEPIGPTTQGVFELMPPYMSDFDIAGAFSSIGGDFNAYSHYDFFVIVEYNFNDGDTSE